MEEPPLTATTESAAEPPEAPSSERKTVGLWKGMPPGCRNNPKTGQIERVDEEPGQDGKVITIPESFETPDERLLFLMEAVQRTGKRPGESRELVPFRAWLKENPAQFAKDLAAVSGRVGAARAARAAVAAGVGAPVSAGPDVGAEKAKALIEELLDQFEGKP